MNALKSEVDRVETWMRANMATSLELTLKVPNSCVRDLAARIVLDYPDAQGPQIALAAFDLSAKADTAHFFGPEAEEQVQKVKPAALETFGMQDRAAFDALPPQERLRRANEFEAAKRKDVLAELQAESDQLAASSRPTNWDQMSPEARLAHANECAAFVRTKKAKVDA